MPAAKMMAAVMIFMLPPFYWRFMKVRIAIISGETACHF